MDEVVASSPMISRKTACPRCGYDFTGLGASWTDRCPLRHTCTECGLDIDLVGLLGRDQVPNWFAGAPGGWFARVLRVPGNAVFMAVPGFPWSTLTVERLARVPLGRLLGIWVPGLLLVFLLSLLIPTIVAESLQVRRDVIALQEFQARSRAAIASATAAGWTPADGLAGAGSGRSQEEASRLIRDCQDDWRPYRLAAGYALDRLRTGEDPRLRGGAVVKGRLKYYGPDFGLRVINTPARELFRSRFWHARDPFPLDWRDLPLRVFACIQSFLPALSATLAMPFAFVLIPSTRRQARVEAGMLARLGLLACAGPAVLLVVMALGYLPGLGWIPESLEPRTLWWRSSDATWLAWTLFLSGGTALWGFLWWWGACQMLRIPRAGLVAGGLFLIPLLLALILAPSDLLRWTILL